MQQQKTSVWSLAGLMVLAAVAWRGYLHFKPKSLAAPKPPFSLEKVRKGELPTIPGPFLTEGSPGTLKFTKVDLGIGYVQSVSESGDILYTWFGDEPIEFAYKDSDGFMRTGIKPGEPIRRLRKQDGSIQNLATKSDLVLTRGGNVFELSQEGGPLVIQANGKTIFDGQARHDSRGMPVWRSGVTISDEGIFPGMFGENNYFFDKNFNVTEAKRERGRSAIANTQSSGVGTVMVNWSETGTASINIFHHGSIDRMDLPEGMTMPELIGARDAVFFYGGSQGPTPLYKLRGGKFTTDALPREVTSFRVLGANSHGDFLMEIQRVDPLLRGYVPYPYRTDTIYISRGHYYDVKEILSELDLAGAKYSAPIGFVQMNPMDEEGNFVVTATQGNYQRVFLLKRQN